MKVAILANNKNSYPRPMAQGLARMLARLGVESRIFKNAWLIMNQASQSRSGLAIAKRSVKSILWRRLLRQLREFDLVVVVSHVPAAYMRYFFHDEEMRQALPKTPIVLYDLVYLPTRGDWLSRALREGDPEVGIATGGHFGIERYDWHLCASVVNHIPMPAEPQPCSLIGIDLDDGSLYPDQRGAFVALLDFEQAAHLGEREVQRKALRETGTSYLELKGQYTTKEIREVYRKCALFFLAFRESFGLPICEAQACGSYVCTPYDHWCPSHWMKADLRVPGPGELTSNFLVYNNDLPTLIAQIERAKQAYEPQAIREKFLTTQGALYRGDLAELERFLGMVRSGEIHAGLRSRQPISV
jgi:hypothetical protein